ncbi:hypothetical protein MN032_00770 [Agromyces atrinae]|uniref:hypothetical protein n=1 Tax=Agromyces atrinae TaxID=592376 RepID=UPI001F55D937|nr:hypothetical protein [Agromyces atrinae]MCI2956206.1 hypothetical protein [Agromyces atrinae]
MTATTPEASTAAPATPDSPAIGTPASSAPRPPSVHVRALLTWLAIFPLVTIGMLLLADVWAGWHPVLRSFALTLVVVPLAVYLVVPNLMKGYGALVRRRAR